MKSGNHKKLTITAYKDKAFTKKGKVFAAMLNPESISQEYIVEYDEEQAIGSPDTNIKYRKTPPASIKFDLILDGTGVANPKKTDVEAELELLKSVVYNYNGSSHQPNYAKVEFAKSNAYTCRMESMSVNITRFRADGSYLRAKVSLSFKQVALESKSKGAQSPDMTHLITVTAGDTLPGLTHHLYENDHHLLKIAAFNKLNSLLYLKPGTELIFPPLNAL